MNILDLVKWDNASAYLQKFIILSSKPSTPLSIAYFWKKVFSSQIFYSLSLNLFT